jgi:hypothetical protein
VLVVDDLFQVHEELVPSNTPFAEGAVVALYGILTALFVWKFRAILRSSPLSLMALAVISFASSVIIDLTLEQRNVIVFLEDGFKLLGILFWASFLGGCAVMDLRRQVLGPRLQQ